MSVAVLVPWAGGCPHRQAAWSYVSSWYATHFPTWTIVRGTSAEGSDWCKAEAVGRALARTDARTLVIADADCVVPGIAEAVRQVENGAAWAIPHRLVHRFNQHTTSLILGGTEPSAFPRLRTTYDQMPYTGFEGGGVTVVRREVYEEVPLDHRFTGWGQEDESWAIALNSLCGKPWRSLSSPLWHLWHPPQRRISRAVGSHASRKLHHQYRSAAAQSAQHMHQHLGPAREFTRSFCEHQVTS